MATIVKQGDLTVINDIVRVEQTLPQAREDSEPIQLWRVYLHDQDEDLWSLVSEHEDYDSALISALNAA